MLRLLPGRGRPDHVQTAHALLDGLRPHYIEPSSPDQGGFHEGFSDVVALLSILSDERIVETILTREKVMSAGQKLVAKKQLGADALRRSTLLGLAECMGETLPNGAATTLRQSVTLVPTPKWLDDPAFAEPHRRGEIPVAAVLNAFIEVWRHRLKGLGEIRRGYLDASRVVEDGATAASHLLTMCIRALDYAPPIDLQFSDYLSSRAIRSAFRRRRSKASSVSCESFSARSAIASPIRIKISSHQISGNVSRPVRPLCLEWGVSREIA